MPAGWELQIHASFSFTRTCCTTGKSICRAHSAETATCEPCICKELGDSSGGDADSDAAQLLQPSLHGHARLCHHEDPELPWQGCSPQPCGTGPDAGENAAAS